jgi:DNA-binding response OmpR family regulator
MAKAKILIVDDEADYAKILEDRLLFEGFDVESACDGIAALERVASSPPDLILLDIMMPQMDGIAFLRQLRSESGSRGIPVIIVTAYGREPSVEELGVIGDAPVMTKPFDMALLLQRIREMLPPS